MWNKKNTQLSDCVCLRSELKRRNWWKSRVTWPSTLKLTTSMISTLGVKYCYSDQERIMIFRHKTYIELTKKFRICTHSTTFLSEIVNCRQSLSASANFRHTQSPETLSDCRGPESTDTQCVRAHLVPEGRCRQRSICRKSPVTIYLSAGAGSAASVNSL